MLHFHTGKAKTASQLLDVSFNRLDEKMSGYTRSQTETSRRGTQNFCCLCVATENLFLFFSNSFHIQMNKSTLFSAETQQCKIVFFERFWSTCFWPARLLQLPVRIINSKSRWVKVYCGAWRLLKPCLPVGLSHWSKPLQTDTLRLGFSADLRAKIKKPLEVCWQDNLTHIVWSSHRTPSSINPKCFTLEIDQIWMVE